MNWLPILAVVVLVACAAWIFWRGDGPEHGCALAVVFGVLEVAAVLWIVKACGG